MKRATSLVAVLIIAAVVSGACNASAARPTATAAAALVATTAAPPPSSPSTKAVPPAASPSTAPSSPKLPSSAPVAAGRPPLGTYATNTPYRPESLTLLDGGQYKQSVESYHITGTWAARQGQLSFTETSESGACGNATGTYTWSYDGTDLKLTLVNDACDARSADFASGPWVKQP